MSDLLALGTTRNSMTYLKTSDTLYQIHEYDTNNFVEAIGTSQTIRLPKISEVDVGSYNVINNNGTNALTLDSLEGTINGEASITVDVGNTVRVIADGTTYRIDYHTSPFPPAAPESFASIYFSTAAETSFSAPNTPTIALGTTTTAFTPINFTETGNNVLTYNGVDNIRINFTASLSITSEDCILSAYIAINGTVVENTKISTQYNFLSTPVNLNLGLTATWYANNGDTVSVYLENNSNTNGASIEAGTIKVWS